MTPDADLDLFASKAASKRIVSSGSSSECFCSLSVPQILFQAFGTLLGMAKSYRNVEKKLRAPARHDNKYRIFECVNCDYDLLVIEPGSI